MNEQTRRILETMTKMGELNRRGWSTPGMHRGEFMALCAIEDLSQEAGEGLTVSALSKKIQVTAPAMSQMLKVLESKRLVKREQSSKDRRVVCVSITDHGASLLEKARQSFEREAAAVLSRLGDEDTARLAEILEKLYWIVKELDAQRTLPGYENDNGEGGKG